MKKFVIFFLVFSSNLLYAQRLNTFNGLNFDIQMSQLTKANAIVNNDNSATRLYSYQLVDNQENNTAVIAKLEKSAKQAKTAFIIGTSILGVGTIVSMMGSVLVLNALPNQNYTGILFGGVVIGLGTALAGPGFITGLVGGIVWDVQTKKLKKHQ